MDVKVDCCCQAELPLKQAGIGRYLMFGLNFMTSGHGCKLVMQQGQAISHETRLEIQASFPEARRS